MIDLIKYIFLGILQGITEPIPISSSGHIFLCKTLFQSKILNDLNLEIFLNFASLIAIVIIYRKEIIEIIVESFKFITTRDNKYKDTFKYILMIVVGTIPVGILGILLKSKIENSLSKNVYIIGFGFLLTAVALISVTNSNGKKKDNEITIKDAIIIGLSQAISIVPGISRSGMTLVGCLLSGLDKKTSLKYTFMLYIPVSISTMILGISSAYSKGMELSLLGYYLLSSIFSIVFTYLSYKRLSKLVEKGKLWRFSIYLFIVAMFTIIYFL